MSSPESGKICYNIRTYFFLFKSQASTFARWRRDLQDSRLLMFSFSHLSYIDVVLLWLTTENSLMSSALLVHSLKDFFLSTETLRYRRETDVMILNYASTCLKTLWQHHTLLPWQSMPQGKASLTSQGVNLILMGASLRKRNSILHVPVDCSWIILSIFGYIFTKIFLFLWVVMRAPCR